jgi:hypothetical protein
MKKINKFLAVIVFLGVVFNINSSVLAQENNENITIQKRSLPDFNKIDISGDLTVILNQDNEKLIEIQADSNILKDIKTSVKNDVLKITGKSKKSPVKIFVTCKDINSIKVSSVSTIKGESEIKADKLEIQSSGATDITLNLNVKELFTDISGASNVALSGTAYVHNAEISGASELKAYDLLTQKTFIDVNGAGSAQIDAKEKVEGKISGAGNISYKEEPKEKNIELSGVASLEKANNDTLKNDTIKLKIGNRQFVITEANKIKPKKKKKKFNGHWAGVDLGINGYLNSKKELNIPTDYEFLELKMNKSICVNINFYEQNFVLLKNHVGLITGLGWQSNNYRFDEDIKLISDTTFVYGYKDTSSFDYIKSKLLVNYLRIPLLLEYQTNSKSKKNSFHITAGVVAGLRISSHTKQVYKDDKDKKYKLKDKDDFHLSPLKYDASVRIGWGKFNLFATYSLNQLFKKHEAPTLYPFTAGLTLVGW